MTSIHVIQRRLLHVFSFSLIALGVALLWRQLQGVEIQDVSGIIGNLGFAAPLILLPYGFSLLCDVLGWRHCMIHPGYPSLKKIFAIRVSTDAVMNTIPVGVAVAEPMRVVLLNKRMGFPIREATSVTILSKMNIVIAHMLFVLVGVFVVLIHDGQLEGIAVLLAGRDVIPLVISFAVIAIVLVSLPYSGPRLTQLLGIVQKIPLSHLRKAVDRVKDALHSIDNSIGNFARVHSGNFVSALIYFFWSWLLLAAETWLILFLLGVEISLTQALIFEGIASVVKVFVFFIPSGLGVQDLSFATMFLAFGLPEAATVAAAFIVLRRSKELFWAVTGFIMLGRQREYLRGGGASEGLKPLREVVL
jgi:uncharacterized protein (TIRG00374 family)